MAVLNKIRQRSFFLIVVIALALFSFVLADLFKNSDALTGGSQDVVATVNGEDIGRQDFMNRVEVVQRSLGPNSTSTQAMNTVYDEKVRSAILTKNAEELGITIEQAFINDRMRESLSVYPEFSNAAGQFDQAKLQEFIVNLKAISPQPAPLGNMSMTWNNWLTFEKNLIQSARISMYENLIKAGNTATISDAELDYIMENETIDVKYVQVPYSSIDDNEVEVSKKEISDYMKKYPELYEAEASRDLNFVEFNEEPTVLDEEEVKENLMGLLDDRVEYNTVTKQNDSVFGFRNTKNDAEFVNLKSTSKFNDRFIFKTALPDQYQDTIFGMNVGQIFGPYKDNGSYKLTKVVDQKQISDSVKVRHILIPFAGTTRVDPSITKTDEQAKKTADSILKIIKTTRSKFVDLLELSSDKVSNAKEGVIEFGYNDAFAPEFKNYSFENNVGDVDVVKTSFGYHIIEILSQTEKKRAIKIATVSEAIEPSERTSDEVYTRASQFESDVQNKVFQDVAEKNDYEVRTVNGVEELQEALPGLGNNRAIVRWAFEEGTDVGDFKKFNLPSGGYAVVQVVAINKKGLMKPENAPTTIITELRNKKKAELIRQKIKATTLDAIATEQNVTTRTATAINMKNPTLSGAGLEPLVIGTAFGLDEGASSKLINGKQGVYMIEVTKKNEAPTLDNYQPVVNRLNTANKSGLLTNKYYEALKKSAEIEDNRKRFY